MAKAFLACLALATAAYAHARRPNSPAPRLDVKAAEARAFKDHRGSWDSDRQGAPCLVERATGRRVCKTMPQWCRLAARIAAGDEAPGARRRR